MKKLIIEEHNDGSGIVCYDGEIREYDCDDENTGDIGCAVSTLIDMGFLNPDLVEFFDKCDNPVIRVYEQLINKDN